MLWAQAVPGGGFDWFGQLWDKGPLAAFFGVALYLLWSYGGRLLEGHIQFMATAKGCLETQTKTLDTLSASLVIHTQEVQKLPRMLGHFAEAGKAAIENADVRRHLEKVIDERDRE